MAFRVLARMLSTPSLLCQPVLDTVVINKTTQCSKSCAQISLLSSLQYLLPFSKLLLPSRNPLIPLCTPPNLSYPLHLLFQARSPLSDTSSSLFYPSPTLHYPPPFQTPNLVCGEVTCKMEPEDLDTGKDYKADKKLQRSFMNGQCILVYLRTV